MRTLKPTHTDFGTRLRKLRIDAGFTKCDFADRVGVSTETVRCWESGIKTPSMDAILSMSDILNMSTDALLDIPVRPDGQLVLSPTEVKLIQDFRALDYYGQKVVEDICSIEKSRMEDSHGIRDYVAEANMITKAPMRFIPKYFSPAAAGRSAPIDDSDYEMIPVDETVPEAADFAVCIQGDSMEPLISDGDTVYVRKDRDLSNGDIGIFCVDGSMYCKEYLKDSKGNLLLASYNEERKDSNVYISSDGDRSVICFGKVLSEGKTVVPTYLKPFLLS